MVQGDSCTTAQHAGREGRSYTMIELLTGIEGDSCKPVLLAGSEGRSYTINGVDVITGAVLLADREMISYLVRGIKR